MSMNDSILGGFGRKLKIDVATLKLRGLGDAAPSRDILAWVPLPQRAASPELGRGRGQPWDRGESVTRYPSNGIPTRSMQVNYGRLFFIYMLQDPIVKF